MDVRSIDAGTTARVQRRDHWDSTATDARAARSEWTVTIYSTATSIGANTCPDFREFARACAEAKEWTREYRRIAVEMGRAPMGPRTLRQAPARARPPARLARRGARARQPRRARPWWRRSRRAAALDARSRIS